MYMRKGTVMNQKNVVTLVLCLVLAQSIPVNAVDFDDAGWFVGGHLGYVSTDADGVFLIQDTENHEADVAGYGAYGGYNFTEWFGLEGAFLMTGDTSGDNDGVANSDYFATSFSPRFTIHLSPVFSIYAKAGLALISYDVEFDTDAPYEDGIDLSWSGVGTSFGVGGQFAVVNGIRIRIGYDVLSGTLTENDFWLSMDDVDAKLEQVSFSMHYQF